MGLNQSVSVEGGECKLKAMAAGRATRRARIPSRRLSTDGSTASRIQMIDDEDQAVAEALLAWHLPDRVARAHRAAHHDPAVGSSQAKLAPGWRVDESQRIDAETR